MSGAYTVTMVGNTGIVPIVPPHQGGIVKFGRVFLSLSWDNLSDRTTNSIPGGIRIWQGTQLRSETRITIPRGRGPSMEMQGGDSAVSFTFGSSALPNNIVVALVEYETE